MTNDIKERTCANCSNSEYDYRGILLCLDSFRRADFHPGCGWVEGEEKGYLPELTEEDIEGIRGDKEAHRIMVEGRDR